MDGEHRLHRVARAQRGKESQGAIALGVRSLAKSSRASLWFKLKRAG